MPTDNVCLSTDTVCLHTDTVCLSTDTVCLHTDKVCLPTDTVCLSTDTVCLSTDIVCLWTNLPDLGAKNTTRIAPNNVYAAGGSAVRVDEIRLKVKIICRFMHKYIIFYVDSNRPCLFLTLILN